MEDYATCEDAYGAQGVTIRGELKKKQAKQRGHHLDYFNNQMLWYTLYSIRHEGAYMKIPAFIFTCRICGGETIVDFHEISFTRTYKCGRCEKPFRISKQQGLSISKQLEDYMNTV